MKLKPRRAPQLRRWLQRGFMSMGPALLTPQVAAGGGGSVSFVAADPQSQEDVTTLTSDAISIAGSNLYAIGAGMKNSGAETFTGSTLFGGAGSFLSAQADVNFFWNCRDFERIAPSTGSQTASWTASAQMGFGLLVAGVYQGVNQTTPKNSTATPTSEDFEGQTTRSASITVTTVTNGVAVAFLFAVDAAGATITLNPGTGVTVRAEVQLTTGRLAMLERANDGGSTVIQCGITYSASTDGGWRMNGYGLQP